VSNSSAQKGVEAKDDMREDDATEVGEEEGVFVGITEEALVEIGIEVIGALGIEVEVLEGTEEEIDEKGLVVDLMDGAEAEGMNAKTRT
jgi:hypothetical protein